MTYSTLITKLEGLTGPECDLDDEILIALGYSLARPPWAPALPYWFPGGNLSKAPLHDEWERPTASIDAAVALVEEKLPGWRLSIFEVSGGWCVRLLGQDGASFSGLSAKLPIALLIALLRALEGEG